MVTIRFRSLKIAVHPLTRAWWHCHLAPMPADCDVVIAGAGHNGLTCAAYLARAGMSVTVLEARDTVGGCASTVDACGARVNICNCDHSVILTTPVIEELDLLRHGLRYLQIDPTQLSMSWDGSASWFAFRDPQRTLDSLALTHPDEVAAYRDYLRVALPAAELLASIAQDVPEPAKVASKLIRARGRGAATVLRWGRMSVGSVVRSLFRSEALRAPLITTGPAVWGVSPEQPGTGLGALGYALKHTAGVSRPAGGSGSLTNALAAAVAAAGGSVRTAARVERILLEGSRVAGVRLSTGEEIRASIVVSAVDPRRAFVEWLAQPPANAETLAAKWRRQPRRDGYESKIDAVVRVRPVYRSVDPGHCQRLGIVDPLLPTAIVAPPVAAIEAAHAAASQGQVAARPMLFVNLPSVADEAMRPPNGDILSLEVLFTPYALRGGWEGSTEPRRWLECYSSLLEEPIEPALVEWRVMTPPDYEAQFSLDRGLVPSYASSPLAAVAGRRDRELTRYETPVDGLYLTGGGTFPGAGIWGASGRNTAMVVLRRHSAGRRASGTARTLRA